MPSSQDSPLGPSIKVVTVRPSKRILQLFNKPGMLTDEEWAELELYEAMQEETNETNKG